MAKSDIKQIKKYNSPRTGHFIFFLCRRNILLLNLYWKVGSPENSFFNVACYGRIPASKGMRSRHFHMRANTNFWTKQSAILTLPFPGIGVNKSTFWTRTPDDCCKWSLDLPLRKLKHHDSFASSYSPGYFLRIPYTSCSSLTNIYLAVSVLSCSTQDLWSLLQHAGSLVPAWRLLLVACGI